MVKAGYVFHQMIMTGCVKDRDVVQMVAHLYVNSPHQTLWPGHVCQEWGCTWSGGGPMLEPEHPEWSVFWPPAHASSAIF